MNKLVGKRPQWIRWCAALLALGLIGGGSILAFDQNLPESVGTKVEWTLGKAYTYELKFLNQMDTPIPGLNSEISRQANVEASLSGQMVLTPMEELDDAWILECRFEQVDTFTSAMDGQSTLSLETARSELLGPRARIVMAKNGEIQELGFYESSRIFQNVVQLIWGQLNLEFRAPTLKTWSTTESSVVGTFDVQYETLDCGDSFCARKRRTNVTELKGLSWAEELESYKTDIESRLDLAMAPQGGWQRSDGYELIVVPLSGGRIGYRSETVLSLELLQESSASVKSLESPSVALGIDEIIPDPLAEKNRLIRRVDGLEWDDVQRWLLLRDSGVKHPDELSQFHRSVGLLQIGTRALPRDFGAS